MTIDERLTKIEDSLSKIDIILEALMSKKTESPKIECTETPKLSIPAITGNAGEWISYKNPPKLETKPIEVSKVEIPTELLNLLNSKEWPNAVDPTLICDITSDQDKEDRAEGILDLIIDTHLENLKFLDFGCGEGHVTNKSKIQKPAMSIGYDIKKHDKWNEWEKTPNTILTDDWDLVKTSGPYNIVLMYDVIDHMLISNEEIINKLKEVKELLAPNGKVYVRTHPFCSRHGTHLYHQLNKAYAHLVFTNKELKSLGYEQASVKKVIHPMAEYKSIFTSAGFKIKYGPNQIKESVEKFFINKEIIAKRIKSNYKDSPDINIKNGQFPVMQLEQQFLDYILV